MRRVVITGIGAVSPLGNSFQKSWESLKAGESGLRPITRFNASNIPWKMAGEIRDFDSVEYLGQKEINIYDPFIRYAVTASFMAAEDAGLIERSVGATFHKKKNPEPSDPEYLSSGGIIIGSSRGGIGTIEQSLMKSFRSDRAIDSSQNRFRGPSPYLMPSTTISMASSFAAQKLGIKGYCLGVSNACASGANALGESYLLLKTGFKGPLLAGGTDAPLCRVCVEGYGASGALSRIPDSSASRPFDRTRDGFVLSEGACVLVLEEYETALKRNVDIYGEIIGYGNTSDAYHITRPDPEGEACSIRRALQDAGIGPERVDYINAHGTSTRIGDAAEAVAIGMVFGKGASGIPVSATKSVTGHMLAASGSFEVATTLMSMNEGTIPPTMHVDERDPSCDLSIITQKRDADIRVAISNSFGFGGVNAVLLLKRLE